MIAISLIASALPPQAFAQLDMLNQLGRAVYGVDSVRSIPEIVGRLINIFLSVLGIIFIFLIFYGGYNWMTAMGAEEKIKTAKQTITAAVIGIVIIIAAYAITRFVITQLIGATNPLII